MGGILSPEFQRRFIKLINLNRFIPAVICAAATAAMAGCGGAKASGSSSIATFNEAPISREDYNKRLETMQVVRVVDGNGNVVQARVAEPMSSQALQMLMIEQAIIQAARDEKVLPSSDDIEKERKFREELQQGYVNELKKMGLSMADIDRQIMLELAQERLTTRGVPEKTMDDVDKYITDNPNITRVPATATFRVIVVESAAEQQAVDADLRGGLPFGSVASMRSKMPNARMNNGSFPDNSAQPRPMAVQGLRPEMQKALNETAEGKISEWVVVDQQRIKIFVEAKAPETKTTLSNAQKERLRRELMAREGQVQNDVQKLIVEKLSKADVKVNINYLRQAWETFQTAVKERSADILGTPSSETPTPAPATGGPAAEPSDE